MHWISAMEEGHLDIMVAALEVSLCLQNIKINKMMRYFTDDKRVLELATIVERLYDSDNISEEKYVKTHITTMRGMLRKLKNIEKRIKCAYSARTDTIGSGVRNLYKYTPIYSDGGKPELIEDDVFRIIIPLDKVAADEGRENFI